MELIIDLETYADPAVIQAHPERLAAMAAKREVSVEEMMALSPPLARVVAIGAMTTDGRKAVWIDSQGEDVAGIEARHPGATVMRATSEAGLLHGFFHALTTRKVSRLITFNGRGFDVPVLFHRALANRVPMAPLVANAAIEYRYRPQQHLDLCDQLAFFGASRTYSLETYAIGLGIPNPKAHGDGSRVGDMVAARRWGEIASYCLDDVQAHSDLYQVWLARFGGMEEAASA